MNAGDVLSEVRDRLYYRVFGADATLAALVQDRKLVVDVGCSDGRGSYVLSRRPNTIGIDIYFPALQLALRMGRRQHVVRADIRHLPLKNGAADVVAALDVIEHFEKPDAVALIRELERVGGKVVLLTPSGFLPQQGSEEEPWQQHRCGFSASELRELGYSVQGKGGPRQLRRDYGAFRFGVIGQLLAIATSPITRQWPNSSFYLLATKPGDG